MRTISKILLLAATLLLCAYFLPGVHVENFYNSVIVAIVLSLLNSFVKPVLVFLTFPVTILTLGLFLIVINISMLYITDYFINGFKIDSLMSAIIISLALSFVTWLYDKDGK